MRKLNNKGYLIVEIIVASSIAMVMLYFLLNLTITLKSINNDYFVVTKLETDRVLMSRAIINDIKAKQITKIYIDTDENIIKFIDVDASGRTNQSVLYIKKENSNNSTFKYGEIDDNNTYVPDNFYEKKFDDRLNVENIVIDNQCYVGSFYKKCSDVTSSDDVEQAYLIVTIPAKNIYDNSDYGIKFTIPYDYGTIKIESLSIEPPKNPI